MKAKVSVSVVFRDVQTLDAVYRSLEPDNTGFPDDMTFDMNRTRSHLSFKMVSDGDITTLLSTLDDILESAQLSLNTLERLEAG